MYSGVRSKRMEFLNRYRSLIYSSVVVAFIIGSIVIVYYFLSNIWIIFLLGVLSALYLLPVFKSRRIRDLSYFKIWAIASVWAIVSTLAPYVIDGNWTTYYPGLMMERFLFFVLITIPFDARDVHEDRAIHVKTLATAMSYRSLKILAVAIFLIHSITLWLLNFDFAYSISIQLVATAAILGFVIPMANRPLSFYSIFLDGLIIIRLLVYLLILKILI